MNSLSDFNQIWCVDFEFSQPVGEKLKPVCMVAREIRSNRLIRLWQDQLSALPEPPFPTSETTLFIAYYASAELGCFLALGWTLPEQILDLFVEFKLKTSGLEVQCGHGLLGALGYHGLPSVEALEKKSMQELALRGNDYNNKEKSMLLDYCQNDVSSLGLLLPKMLPTIDLPRALLRGRYMKAIAKMEWQGIPIDTDTLSELRANWVNLQDQLIAETDKHYGVFEKRIFKRDLFAMWLEEHKIPWPKLESGALDLTKDTFRDMAKIYPNISTLYELRTSLSQLRLKDLAVGSDGRNRCLLSAFSSKTGRNQPSTSKFVFGPATWIRSLIKPSKKRVLAYIDWEQQEFGIAAALSNDQAMMDAYQSGDPYLTFAKQAGAVPQSATKQSHKNTREQFKVCALAVQYGMGANSLGQKLGISSAYAKELLDLHKRTYKKYWQWSDDVLVIAQRDNKLTSTFGWQVSVGKKLNYRSLRNFLLQANGAEMLRLACILATERGIKVCAPIHDALLIETSTHGIDEPVDIVATQFAMEQASQIVLAGFPLRTDVKTIRYPDRYIDDRGKQMWDLISNLLSKVSV